MENNNILPGISVENVLSLLIESVNNIEEEQHLVIEYESEEEPIELLDQTEIELLEQEMDIKTPFIIYYYKDPQAVCGRVMIFELYSIKNTERAFYLIRTEQKKGGYKSTYKYKCIMNRLQAKKVLRFSELEGYTQEIKNRKEYISLSEKKDIEDIKQDIEKHNNLAEAIIALAKNENLSQEEKRLQIREIQYDFQGYEDDINLSVMQNSAEIDEATSILIQNAKITHKKVSDLMCELKIGR